MSATRSGFIPSVIIQNRGGGPVPVGEPVLRDAEPPVGAAEAILECVPPLLAILVVALACVAGPLGAQEGLGEGGVSLDLRISACVVNAVGLIDLIVVALRIDADEEAMDALLQFFFVILSLYDLLESLNGFGQPDAGSKFGDGSTKFSGDITSVLQGALPGDWFGAAADNYARKLGEQQARAAAFAVVDREIANIVAAQAGQVEGVRLELAAIKLAFSGMFSFENSDIGFMVASLESVCGESQLFTEALIFLVGIAASGGLLASLGLIIDLIVRGEKNHKSIRSARREYVRLVDDVGANISTVGRALVAGVRGAGRRSH